VVVEGLSKSFRIPQNRNTTLKGRLVDGFRRERHETLHALDAVSFDVREGEFFGIVGRNGSGKSTLLKCLAGIYDVDEGDVGVAGRLAPFVELGAGFDTELTGRENVLVNAVMLGLRRRQARQRLDRIVAFGELQEFVDLKLKNYSSGMSVRLSFSVATQVDADVLLIDEVLAVGDAAFQEKCFAEFERLKRQGRTIVFVTHDMTAVERFCDRALLLDRGRMVATGDPATVANRYLQLNFPSHAEPENVEALLEAAEGDGSVIVEDLWWQDTDGRRVQVLEQGSACGLCMRVRFRRATADPVFGFVMSDDQHRQIFTVTTEWDGRETGSYGAGEILDVALSFDNWFAPGRYYASPRVVRAGDGREPLGESEVSASVVVSGSRVGAGLVDIPHEFHFARRYVAGQVAASEASS
jgi:ABC-type polysaccharide/polyol phosphate transport system ATPase subunit